MNKEIIICVGISGSGKSTFSTQLIKENSNYLRINRDSIRQTLVGDLEGYYQRKDMRGLELTINNIEYILFKDLFNNNKSIIIDNTNLKQEYINKWVTLSQDFNISHDFKFKLFDIDLDESKRRVCKRENMQNFEDLNYIDKQYQDYQEIKKFIETKYKDKII